MDFKIEDMINCFLYFDREDLVEELEFIISELGQVFESESSQEEEEDENIEYQVDEDGFYSLK